jgi:hypothetical protein
MQLSFPSGRVALGVFMGLALVAAPVASASAQSVRSSSDSNSGYVDSAIPTDRFRIRYDAANDDTSADRAEFFYQQYQPQLITGAPGSVLYVNTPPSGRVTPTGGGGGGGGGGPGPNRGNGQVVFAQPGDLIGNLQANGLPKPEVKINYQEVSSYLEMKASDTFSGFVEVPARFLDPQVNQDTAGVGDMNAGFKWAFLYEENWISTFQMRTYIPTGPTTQGLGTGHVSLEPALLTWSRLADRFIFEGEFRDWIPIGGTDFAGNVLRYGFALSTNVYDSTKLRVVPVTELVGWTVLGGKETVALTPTLFEIRDAAGSTIVNAKVGIRTYFGEHSDVYVGYGRALTGDVWYKNMFRLEYQLSF